MHGKEIHNAEPTAGNHLAIVYPSGKKTLHETSKCEQNIHQYYMRLLYHAIEFDTYSITHNAQCPTQNANVITIPRRDMEKGKCLYST